MVSEVFQPLLVRDLSSCFTSLRILQYSTFQCDKIHNMDEIRVFTDGGSRGNPGPAATGVYIEDENGKKIIGIGTFLGDTTNNVAEYSAVIEALTYISSNKNLLKEGTKIKFFLDSNLVCSQVKGLFKVKNSNLKTLLLKVREKEREIGFPIEYQYIPREKNTKADSIVNFTLDNHT